MVVRKPLLFLKMAIILNQFFSFLIQDWFNIILLHFVEDIILPGVNIISVED